MIATINEKVLYARLRSAANFELRPDNAPLGDFYEPPTAMVNYQLNLSTVVDVLLN